MATHTPRSLPRSLYAATAIPAPPTPPLEGEASADIAIIGGGFTGLSTALHLAERGIAVTLIEANEPGWGASGRNGGQVNPGLKHTPDEIETKYGELGKRMVGFSHAAPDYVFDLVRRFQLRCAAHQGGTLRAAIGRKAAEELRRLQKVYEERGHPTRLLEGAALRDATGTDFYTIGLLDPRGGDLNPLSYARGLAGAAMALGARIHGGTPALALRPGTDGWEIATPNGKLRAGRVLLATNGYTDSLWHGLAQSLVPLYSSVRASAPLPEKLAASIVPFRGSVYETGRVTVYYRVDDGNRLVIGSRGPQRDLTSPAPIAYLVAHAELLWPQLKGIEWAQAWNGQLAYTEDHYPHVHALAPGLYAAYGYNGRGVAMASHMGKALSGLLTEGEAGFDMPITPMQPIAFHRFWKLGVWSEITRMRVLDKLGL
ncbi:NAD(P)/FAD-dependent oxidoreductase [Siccirubricoccus phaeus]|uniref:NAD(P)/FAD-dependent oxidoreductase n=1 Tax=Siccirubricoccus phaeus TaxID=2595053 RepID=UPI0011F3DBA0|nr:FAD-binding oxidoreductase [Siccirubricoccus phaeus]